MLYASAPRIRRAAPDALILIGNTAAAGSDDAQSASQGVSPMTFVREMACVDETLKPLDRPECRDFRPLPGDGFAHHPYTQQTLPGVDDPDPQHVRLGGMARLDALLGRLRAVHRTERRLPLFSTEYGYETNPPDPRQPWTPEDQANLIAEAEMQAHRDAYDLRGWAQFLLRDIGPRPGRPRGGGATSSRACAPTRAPRSPRWRRSASRWSPGPRPRAPSDWRAACARTPRAGRSPSRPAPPGRWVPAPTDRPVRTDADGFFAALLRSPAGATALRARAGAITSRPLVLAAD